MREAIISLGDRGFGAVGICGAWSQGCVADPGSQEGVLWGQGAVSQNNGILETCARSKKVLARYSSAASKTGLRDETLVHSEISMMS